MARKIPRGRPMLAKIDRTVAVTSSMIGSKIRAG
jgi:hypothetical protein